MRAWNFLIKSYSNLYSTILPAVRSSQYICSTGGQGKKGGETRHAAPLPSPAHTAESRLVCSCRAKQRQPESIYIWCLAAAAHFKFCQWATLPSCCVCLAPITELLNHRIAEASILPNRRTGSQSASAVQRDSVSPDTEWIKSLCWVD